MKKIYFVGNAHIDPAWLWSWQEGSAATKATIRSALDRMKEYPAFKFVCSASLVYEWIEYFDPKMFEEIKERVNEGRFIIVGGWYVQPDCNLPCGEGFARQGLAGQRYFKEKFGVTAKTGYNVDSFGHNLMLPQILKKQGMNQYIFMRGRSPYKLFLWRSPDGSEVLCHRISGMYCNKFTEEQELEELIDLCSHSAAHGTYPCMVFYGVGNHGGGPTKRHIDLILQRAESTPEEECIFSDISDYFDEVRKDIDPKDIPVYTNDMQFCNIGCYSALADTKAGIREGENALLSAEIYNLLEARLVQKPYRTEKISEAWKGVLFAHFHDVAGGTCTESVVKGYMPIVAESQAIAARLTNNALQTVSWAIDTSDPSRGIPVVMFNSLPFDVEDVVIATDVGPIAARIADRNGKGVPAQNVIPERHLTNVNNATIIKAHIPAMGFTTYYYEMGEEGTPLGEQAPGPFVVWESGMENEHLRVEFEMHTGHILSIFDKDDQRELLSGNSAVPVVYDEMGHTTWSHFKTGFDRKIGMFTDAQITIVEKGPVRAMIKVESVYHKSKLTQFFSLTADRDQLDVRAIVDWHEEHKALKLMYQTNLEQPKAFFEIPFGVAERVTDGSEQPGQRWIAMKDDRYALALINSNTYGFSVENNAMLMTIVRSPLFAHHSYNRPLTPFSRFTDQGEHAFEYAFMKCDTNGWGKVVRAAGLLNQKPVVIVENNHEGRLSDEFHGIHVDCDHVQVSALKRAEDGDGFIIRIYETDGKRVSVNITGEMMPAPLSVSIKPYEINTYRIDDNSDEWREVLMTEFEK